LNNADTASTKFIFVSLNFHFTVHKYRWIPFIYLMFNWY